MFLEKFKTQFSVEYYFGKNGLDFGETMWVQIYQKSKNWKDDLQKWFNDVWLVYTCGH